ncbi:MAG TPA: GerMN domain-containing protein [Nocardioides sp.]|nr:GerMN domain-containing protein [Nocardioides sp.]
MSRRRTALVVLLGCLSLATTGCLGIPEDGPIVETQSEVDPNEQLGYYNNPRPPTPGDPPAEVVSGFLDALTAIPVQTNTAEEYLTREAAASWRPQRRTITYADASLPEGSNRVTVELSGAHQVSGGGAWRGPLPPEQQLLTFSMERENGEWRIGQAPDALVVPESWFGQAFRRVSVYFLDPSAQILVPEPVFLPRGDQLATALVSRLVQGPSPRLRDDVERTFIPTEADVDLSVAVSESGVADIPLTGGVPMPTEQDAALMVAQFAWTLAQDSSVTSMRITVDGEPVVLSEGSGTDTFPMDRGRFYDPTGGEATSQLFALRDGRLVLGPPGDLTEAPGRMGSSELGISAIGVNLPGTRVAGVTRRGDRILLADLADPDSEPLEVVQDGTRLLPPSWDFADRMWVTNRPSGGAQLSVRDGGRTRPVTVPGVTGEEVAHLLVSRDGSRLVAVIDRRSDDRVVVSRIQYDRRGRVRGGTPAREITWDDQSRLSVLDVGWSSPTSLTVLHRLSGDLSQVRTLQVDGSPAGLSSISVTLQGGARRIVSSPRATDPLLVRTRAGLLDVLAGSDSVVPDSGDLTAATYVG